MSLHVLEEWDIVAKANSKEGDRDASIKIPSMGIAAKRSRQSVFDDDGDCKGIQQTSLRSFFGPTKKQVNGGHGNAHDRTMTANSSKKAKNNNRTNSSSISSSSSKKTISTTEFCATTKKQEQMYLDLGQRKNYGTAECKVCGMLFTIGLAEDTATHAKVCNDYKSGIAFSNRINGCRSMDITPRISRIVEVRRVNHKMLYGATRKKASTALLLDGNNCSSARVH
jgi:zinc-finger of acetyl-transferase ESCO